MDINHKKVIDYFGSIESRLGYDYVLWGSKHFGFYPNKKADISEKKAQVLLQDLVAKNLDLKPGQLVLDAGCGQGVVSAYLAKKYGVKIIGITIIPFEVKKATSKAKKIGISDIVDYQLMDYTATTFPNNYFDAIYTTESLVHSPDIRKTLKEFYRILKPGGKIAFFEYTIAPDNRFTEEENRMRDLVIEGSAMMGLKEFNHDHFVEVVNIAGFTNVKEQNITDHIRPSFYRLHRYFIIPYKIIKIFSLQKYFINTTASFEFYKMAEKDLFRYCIFTANKPL